jgi:hypothetical protein
MFFFPTGLWAMAFDNVGAFLGRPKQMRQEEFNAKKLGLASTIK